MRNFKQSKEIGVPFSRAYRVTLENPWNKPASLTCVMEKLTHLSDGDVMSTDDGIMPINMPVDAKEANTKIPLIDRQGTHKGELTFGEMAQTVILYINSIMIYKDKLDNLPDEVEESEVGAQLPDDIQTKE